MNPGMMGESASPLGVVLPPTLNLKLFQQEGDQLDYTHYDRIMLNNAGGAINRSFFEIGLGQTDAISARRKTLADTNLRDGRIPEGQAFAAFVLKFWHEFNANLSEANYLSWIQWMRDTVIQINIDTKQEYGTWKISELLGIPNNSLIVPAAAGSNVALQSVGMFQSLKPLNLYIPFPRLTSWTIAMIQGTAPAAALDNTGICCGLVGIRNRAG
jgi:hypothetical protein